MSQHNAIEPDRVATKVESAFENLERQIESLQKTVERVKEKFSDVLPPVCPLPTGNAIGAQVAPPQSPLVARIGHSAFQLDRLDVMLNEICDRSEV